MREGVCLQILQRQAPEVHTLRGPGRPEVPLSPLQQVLREERQIKDPHLTRSRETPTPQGTETLLEVEVCTGLWMHVCVVLKETAPSSSNRKLYIFIRPRKNTNYCKTLRWW